MLIKRSTGVDFAKFSLVTFEEQRGDLLSRIRDFDAEVSAIVGPISPEQAEDLRRRYHELVSERDLLQELAELGL
jgi:hypothetical protein